MLQTQGLPFLFRRWEVELRVLLLEEVKESLASNGLQFGDLSQSAQMLGSLPRR
jgi:hypothetical protein